MANPQLPTYRALAESLERKNGSGARLVGWTVARTILIAPPFAALGVPMRQVVLGSLLSSTIITMFAYLRMYDAANQMQLAGPRRAQRRLR